MTEEKRKFGDLTPEERAANMAKAHARISFLAGRIKSPDSIPAATYFYIADETNLIKSWNYDENKIEDLVAAQSPAEIQEVVEITVAEKGRRITFKTAAENIVYANGVGWMRAADLQLGESIKRMIDGVFASSPVVSVKKSEAAAFYLTKTQGLANFDPSNGFMFYCDCDRAQKIKDRYAKSQKRHDDSHTKKKK